jgi:hypothetical protein
MIARSFKSVVWVGAIGAAAVTCYMFSLQVAEERAGLAELEAQIQRTRQSIQTLKTELGTRSRVHQLQHWASADFGFAAPVAGQFMQDEVTLASLDDPVEAPAMEAPVQLAQAPAPAPAMPRAVQASAPAPAPQRPAVRQASATPERPLLRQASVVTAAAAPKAPSRPAVRTAAPAPRPARPALVDQRTLRDIDSRASAERGSARDGARPR